MRNLLWKDFWQNSRVLLAVVIVAVGPYVVALVIGATQYFVSDPSLRSWTGPGGKACGAGMVLSVILAAFIGATAIAGERVDRSAEFAALLPIARRQSVASKAAIGVVSWLVLWMFNAMCVLSITWLIQAAHQTSSSYGVLIDTVLTMTMCGAVGVLLFGIAWLFSSLLNSPAIAAAAAIGTAATLATAVVSLRELLPKGPLSTPLLVCLIAIPTVGGLLSFAAGTVISLRRAEL
ncbi:MAG: ABC transporter permease subunit [Phycisphaerae bacterium]|nr:ABC transporter permease subunit [Phycisphaerae bacterium]